MKGIGKRRGRLIFSIVFSKDVVFILDSAFVRLLSRSSAVPERSPMAPGIRDLQLTALSGRRVAEEDGGGDLEDVRLLDAYDREESGLAEGEELAAAGEGDVRSLQLKVTGMTCSACSNSVEAALTALPGVSKATVSLLQNMARVIFDPSLVTVCDSSK